MLHSGVRYIWNAGVAAKRLLELSRLLMKAWQIEEGMSGVPKASQVNAIEVPWNSGPCSIEIVRDESVVRDNALKYKA